MKQIIYGLLVGCLLFACADKDEVSPSYEDRNWYVVENVPGASALDQLRYEIFKETDIPIFYNDTLGKEIRYGAGGDPYTYYHVFEPGYRFISSGSYIEYVLPEDEEAITCMAEILRDYTIPLLTPTCRPRGFLVLDTLTNRMEQQQVMISMYKDLEMSLVSIHPSEVSKYPVVTEMTEEQKEIYGYEMALPEVYAYLQREDPTEMKHWASFSEDACGSYDVSFTKPDKDPRKYGYFRLGRSLLTGGLKVITLQDDVSDYVKIIHFNTDTEIREDIGEYPLMVEKYELMLDILKKNGFEYLIHK